MDTQKIESLKRIIEKDPNALLAQFGLAKAYMDGGNFTAAAAHFREAIRIKPDYTAAYRFLGISLEKSGNLEEAKEVFRQGLQVSERTGDMEAGKVMAVFLKRLESGQ